MRTRSARRVLTGFTAAASLMMLASGPAIASDKNWGPLTGPADQRKCSATKDHGNFPNIKFQPCIVFAGPGSATARPTLIVSNTGTETVTIRATITSNWGNDFQVNCAVSPFVAGGHVQCQGDPGQVTRCGRSTTYADLTVDGRTTRSTSKRHDWHPTGC
ncbi:hypothetical protein [Streptomyces jumonjinensis]|uniref:hypothetical protein n=1 Tax=Streptomyces jumonjinensis TaxID=1945 RepID=UPI003799F6F1